MPAARRTWRGWIPSAVLAALAFVFAGCDSTPSYPPSLEFPQRSDRLVLRVPTSQPTGLGEAGKLDSELAAIDSLGGLTLDPAAVPTERRTAIAQFLESFGS